jgi:hypothetical protein
MVSPPDAEQMPLSNVPRMNALEIYGILDSSMFRASASGVGDSLLPEKGNSRK